MAVGKLSSCSRAQVDGCSCTAMSAATAYSRNESSARPGRSAIIYRVRLCLYGRISRGQDSVAEIERATRSDVLARPVVEHDVPPGFAEKRSQHVVNVAAVGPDVNPANLAA